MDFLHLGVEMVCAERNIRLDQLPALLGVAKVASENPGPIGRLVAKAAAELMTQTGQGNSAPAIHLALIAKQANWIPQHQDAVNIVLGCLEALRPMEKQSFDLGSLAGAGESLAKGVGYGTLGAGIGAGTLWWLLSRHALQNDAKQKAQQGQIDYYNQLSSEIQDQMRRRYGYTEPQPTAQPKPGRRARH